MILRLFGVEKIHAPAAMEDRKWICLTRSSTPIITFAFDVLPVSERNKLKALSRTVLTVMPFFFF